MVVLNITDQAKCPDQHECLVIRLVEKGQWIVVLGCSLLRLGMLTLELMTQLFPQEMRYPMFSKKFLAKGGVSKLYQESAFE